VIQYGVHFDPPEGDESPRKPGVRATGRGFESLSLQRRVRGELDTAGSAINVSFHSGLPNVVDSPTTLNDSLTVIRIPCRTVIQHRVLFPKIRTRTARARG